MNLHLVEIFTCTPNTLLLSLLFQLLKLRVLYFSILVSNQKNLHTRYIKNKASPMSCLHIFNFKILDLFLHYRKPTPPPQNNKIWARTRIKNTNRYERTTTRIKNKSRRSRGGRWSRQWLRKCLRPPYSLVCTSWPRPPCRDAEGVGVSVGSATWGVKGYFRWRRRRRQKSLQVEEGTPKTYYSWVANLNYPSCVLLKIMTNSFKVQRLKD